MRRAIPLFCALALLGALPAARGEPPRTSALDLALRARPQLAGSLSEATRAVLSLIGPEEAAALARGELRLRDLALPDGTPVSYFLESVLGNGQLAIPFYSMDAGGGESLGGDFHLVGTMGQPDAAVLADPGAGLTLVGGFRGRLLTDFDLFKDGFETADTSRWSSHFP